MHLLTPIIDLAPLEILKQTLQSRWDFLIWKTKHKQEIKLVHRSYNPLLSVALLTACALYHLAHSLQGTHIQALSDSRMLTLYMTKWEAPERNQITGSSHFGHRSEQVLSNTKFSVTSPTIVFICWEMCGNQGFLKSSKAGMDFHPYVSQVGIYTMGQLKPSCLNLFESTATGSWWAFEKSQNVSSFFQITFFSALKFLMKLERKSGKLCLIWCGQLWSLLQQLKAQDAFICMYIQIEIHPFICMYT